MMKKQIVFAFTILFLLSIFTPSVMAIESVTQVGNTDGDSSGKRSLLETGARFGAAFAATSAIKGLFGMAPGYLTTFLPAMGASFVIPALICAGLIEGAISLTVFSAITGIKDRQWLVRAFLMASVVSVAATFFLSGMMAPWLVALISNGLRLAMFSMLTRPPDKTVAAHLVDEVKEVVGTDNTDDAEEKNDNAMLVKKAATLSISEIQDKRMKAYKGYMNAENSEERTSFYYDFKHFSQLLTNVREKTVETVNHQ